MANSIVRVTCVVALVLFGASACITPPNLHTPRPVEPGDVELGIHGTAFLPPIIPGEDTEDINGDLIYLIPNPSFTGRVGIIDRLELGASLNFFGIYGSLMYGFFPHESPFQLSAIGGVGRFGPLFTDENESEGVASLNLGGLIGYDIRGIIMPYGGARHYWFGTEAVDGLGRIQSTNYIIGAELFPDSPVSVPLELNYSVSSTLQKIISDLGDDAGEDAFAIIFPSVNFGITVTF